MLWLKKFVGFKVLEYFLIHPSGEIYLNELARELNISKGSVKTYCDELVECGITLETEKGNLRLFRLNKDDFAVRAIVKAYYLLKLKGLGIERLAVGCTSLAIYGSFASGNIDSRSDLDILVIGEEADINRDRLREIEEVLRREIQLTVLPYYRWEKMKGERDRFAESVLKNHVLIRGVEL